MVLNPNNMRCPLSNVKRSEIYGEDGVLEEVQYENLTEEEKLPPEPPVRVATDSKPKLPRTMIVISYLMFL